jgi:OOP family OmpA-OmpF porin
MNSSVKIFVLTGVAVVGMISLAQAETDSRDTVRSWNGQIVHSTNGNCVRTQWISDSDACAPPQEQEAQQMVVQPQKTPMVENIPDEKRTVYFEFNRYFLSAAAKERLNTLAEAMAKDRNVKEAKIVGYADRIGSASYNERLSQKRAETVRDFLIEKKFTDGRVTETRWVGKSQPSTHCDNNQTRAQLIACLQQDRRVEVEIGYTGKTPTSNAQ